MAELKNVELNTGAILTEREDTSLSFGNDEEARNAAGEGVAFYDRSHWGLLKFTGEDRLRYLHNQSTNDFNRLQPGQGCDTVFLTSTARTLDLATAYVTKDAVLVVVSPNRRQQLLTWLDNFIFPMDRVQLQDISPAYAIFTLIGGKSEQLLQNLGVENIIAQPQHTHQQVTIDATELIVAVGSGLTLTGYTLIVPREKSAAVGEQIIATGAVPMGEKVWEQLRILEGRPAPDAELTEDYNPLEAGLWSCISFEKGCYIGQETIARLNTYRGVKQKLWGVKLDLPVEPGTTITVEEEKVGILTSYTDTEEGNFGLAYVRTKAGGVGLRVNLGTATGELVAVPFLSHEYYQSKS